MTRSAVAEGWFTEFANLGHEPTAGMWTCVRCMRTMYDIVKGDRMSCQSPSIRDGFLFFGGPFHGQWMRVPTERVDGKRRQTPVWLVALSNPVFLTLEGEDPPVAVKARYRLELLNGTPDFWRYVFESVEDMT